jgi:carboxyl-terminal processing protease
MALLTVALCTASFALGAGAVSAVRPTGQWQPESLVPPALSLTVPPALSRTLSAADRQGEIAGILAGGYYRPLDSARMAAIPVASLPTLLNDPYTRYLDPAALATFQRGDSGHYAGVGIHAGVIGANVVLDRVTSGGPAARANLHPGDMVVSANGNQLRGLALEGALKKIRGPIGTTVVLKVRRGKTTRTLTLRRAEVTAQIVSYKVRAVAGQRVGYIQVLDFSRDVGQQTRAAIKKLTAKHVSQVVLDLRGNGGGLVDEAVALTSVFVHNGTAVFTESGQHIDSKTYRTQKAPADLSTPLAVLVDKETASSAEIVTGALRDAHRATVVGTKTFGKGVIQDLVPLKGGGALKYTMAEYLTPSGQHVDHRGITPDVLVANPATHQKADLALAAAIHTLMAHGIVTSGSV